MQLLTKDTPGKVGGQPGNAFELVYGGVTDAVRKKMHAVDPVLGEYIRWVLSAVFTDHDPNARTHNPSERRHKFE